MVHNKVSQVLCYNGKVLFLSNTNSFVYITLIMLILCDLPMYCFPLKKISMVIFPCKISCLHECMPVSTGLWLWKTLVSLHTIPEIMWHSVSNQMTAQYPWHADTCWPSWVMSTPRLLVSHSPGVWIIYNSQNNRTWGKLHSVGLRHYTPVSNKTPNKHQINIHRTNQSTGIWDDFVL